MVRRIVLDQIDFAGTITAERPFEIVDVGLGVENGLEVIKEASAVQFDGAKYLQGVSLSCGGDLWLRAPGAPRSGRAWGLGGSWLRLRREWLPFRFGLFFKVGIAVTDPFGLKCLVGPGQHFLRPLDRELKAVQDT